MIKMKCVFPYLHSENRRSSLVKENCLLQESMIFIVWFIVEQPIKIKHSHLIFYQYERKISVQYENNIGIGCFLTVLFSLSFVLIEIQDVN